MLISIWDIFILVCIFKLRILNCVWNLHKTVALPFKAFLFWGNNFLKNHKFHSIATNFKSYLWHIFYCDRTNATDISSLVVPGKKCHQNPNLKTLLSLYNHSAEWPMSSWGGLGGFYHSISITRSGCCAFPESLARRDKPQPSI